MGLIILGAENLASDQADQNPNTYKRSKEPATNPWPEPTGWIEYKYDHDKNPVKMIYHNYITMPTVTIPATVTEIDLRPTKLTEIPDEWLSQNGVIEHVYFPATLNKIGVFAFNRCTSLEITEIPASVEIVGQQAFYFCLGISSLRIGSRTRLNYQAFYNCKNLETVECGAYYLENRVFENCKGLKKAWFRSTCETINASISNDGTIKYSQFIGAADDLAIYAEPASKPAGWSQYYNYTGASGSIEVTVTYNQTTRPF